MEKKMQLTCRTTRNIASLSKRTETISYSRRNTERAVGDIPPHNSLMITKSKNSKVVYRTTTNGKDDLKK